MRIIIQIILFCLFSNRIFGQPDSITAVNCFKHVIKDGKITNERYVVNQKTFNSHKYLIKEITFGDSSHQVHRISYFFYKNNQLLSQEAYNSTNSLLNVLRYQYNSLNKPVEILLYEPEKGLLELKKKNKFTYADTLLVKKVSLNNRNKWLEKSSWNYFPEKIISSTIYSKKLNSNYIERIDTTCFLKGKKITAKNILTIDRKASADSKTIEFLYLPETVLIEKEYLKNNNGDTITTILNSYNADKLLFKKIFLDENKKKTACYSIEYNRYFLDPGKKEMTILPK
jgi:hypothetical protein